MNVVALQPKRSKLVTQTDNLNTITFRGKNGYMERVSVDDCDDFGKIPVMTYFLYCVENTKTKNGSGVYLKISTSQALCVLDDASTFGILDGEYLPEDTEYYITHPGDICDFKVRSKVKQLATELRLI